MKRVLALTAFATILITACGGSPESDISSTNGTAANLELVVETALEWAHNDDRTDASQVEKIEQARIDGSISLATMRDATEDMNACLLESGLTTLGVTSETQSGIEFPYVHGIQATGDITDPQAEAIIAECDARFVAYVSYVYSQQPQAQDQYWIEARQHEPRIRECLKEASVPDDEVGETIQEVIATAAELLHPDLALNPYGVHECLEPLDLPLSN